MDEVQQKGYHMYGEQEYLDVFSKQMGKSSQLKQMLISGDTLANEL